MTRAEFARYMGVHKSQVSRWCAMGMPTNPDGSISPEPARTWVRRHIDPTRRATAQHRVSPPSRRLQQPPPAPPGCSHLQDNVVQLTLAAALPMVAPRMAASAAAAATAHGATREVAEDVFRYAACGAMQAVTSLLTELKIPHPPGVDSWAVADIWSIEQFTLPNLEAAGAV